MGDAKNCADFAVFCRAGVENFTTRPARGEVFRRRRFSVANEQAKSGADTRARIQCDERLVSRDKRCLNRHFMDTRTQLRLVSPDAMYRETFMRAVQAFQAEGLSWWTGGDVDLAAQDFQRFVDKKRSDANWREDGSVPKTHLWAIAAGEFVGRISNHHALTDALRISGGHIGYYTLPSMRGNGIATEMLRQALPLARQLGLAEVLITCNASNTASVRVVEKNGGVLRDERSLGDGLPRKRYYWISLRE